MLKETFSTDQKKEHWLYPMQYIAMVVETIASIVVLYFKRKFIPSGLFSV